MYMYKKNASMEKSSLKNKCKQACQKRTEASCRHPMQHTLHSYFTLNRRLNNSQDDPNSK